MAISEREIKVIASKSGTITETVDDHSNPIFIAKSEIETDPTTFYAKSAAEFNLWCINERVQSAKARAR